MMSGRKLIQSVLSVIGILVIVGYSYFVLDDFVRGPRIIISSPVNGFSTTTPAINIVGRAIHTNNLTINDGLVPVDLSGDFSSQLILAPGYNIIKVAAKDNYARTIEKTIEINLVSATAGTSPVRLVATTTPLLTTPPAYEIQVPAKPTVTTDCLPGQNYSVLTGKPCS